MCFVYLFSNLSIIVSLFLELKYYEVCDKMVILKVFFGKVILLFKIFVFSLKLICVLSFDFCKWFVVLLMVNGVL